MSLSRCLDFARYVTLRLCWFRRDDNNARVLEKLNLGRVNLSTSMSEGSLHSA